MPTVNDTSAPAQRAHRWGWTGGYASSHARCYAYPVSSTSKMGLSGQLMNIHASNSFVHVCVF